MQACGLCQIGGEEDNAVGNIWGGPVDDQEGTESAGSLCYMVALDYRDGYDWRSDEARESVKCSLVVYRDGIPMMKVPVGNLYDSGTDPDMHRIVEGHLYTDYSVDGETIIKKDGVPLFRYDGCEAICGMAVKAGDTYTLGRSRTGEGFSFRRNGEIVIAREQGDILSGLVDDCDSLCFSFTERIINSDGLVERHYVSINGKVAQVAVREDIRKVWDVTVCNGKIVYVASLVGVSLPVMFVGDSMIGMSLPIGSELVSCSLFKAGDKVGAEGIYRFPNGRCNNVLWIDGNPLVTFGGAEVISAFGAYDDGVFCVVNPERKDRSGTIYRNGEVYKMPEGYVVMGNGSIAMINGLLHVGMSSLTGDRPLLWKDGAVDTLQVNGYITNVSAVP